MEVDDIETQVRKFQRISCNNNDDKLLDSTCTSASNPNINIITSRNNNVSRSSTYEEAAGWAPSSRIVRVSRASGGKDRHSKVLTSKGLRDRRVRLSVTTAIQFYDLQDRLGYDQPSKALEWLIKAASASIADLPPLDPFFVHFNSNNNNVVDDDDDDGKKVVGGLVEEEEAVMVSKSYNSSSASEETSSKGGSGGGGVCVSRSENRIRARERARGLAASKKEKETASASSFTDLLTSGGISRNSTTTNNNNNNNNISKSDAMDYFQMEQQFGNNCSQSQQQALCFLQENLSYATSSSSGYSNKTNNRGTLQSNLMSTNLPPPSSTHHFQRFQPMAAVDGSTNLLPFFIPPNMGTNQFLSATGTDSQRLRLYGGDGGGHYYEYHGDKSKS